MGGRKRERRAREGKRYCIVVAAESPLMTVLRIRQYTRYRRWTRVAVLSETVEWVNEEDVPAEAKDGQRLLGLPLVQSPLDIHAQPNASTVAGHKVDTPLTSPTRKGTQDSIGSVSSQTSSDHSATPSSDEGSRLRQRLRAVVNGVAH